jgi:hypothetical protein
VIEVRKLLDQPIIRGHMDAGLGANINSGRLTGTSNAKSTVTETPSAGGVTNVTSPGDRVDRPARELLDAVQVHRHRP